MNKISGAEYPVKKIFSNEFDFVIPPYQRPYAWEVEQAEELFLDLFEFMQSQDANEAYFLGSIVLVKEETKPKAEVIDGQQRLTTLTILLAVLAEALDGPRGQDFAKYVNEPGNEAEEIEPKPRLALRQRDRDFFQQYVQEMKFADLVNLDPAQLTDVRRNIRANAELFYNKIHEALNDDQQLIFEFGKFVINRCYLVAVSTASKKSAYRIFSVLNDRGMDLLPSDLLKADIIGNLPKSQSDLYNDKWEELEEELGRDAFNDLFGYIRMIFVRAKLKKTILEEVQELVLPQVGNGANFIDNVLDPFAEAYAIISNAAFQSSLDATPVNSLLEWLLRIDNSDWIPPAIVFLAHHKEDAGLLEAFFADLERLASSMFLRRLTVNDRIDRYAKVITAIEKDNFDVNDPESPLKLTDEGKQLTLEKISGDVYTMSKRPRTYLLLRLDSFLSDQAAVYNHKILTVEHVLPQTVDPESEWQVTWPDEDQRLEWMHKLGNLVLLSRRKNSQAQNYDFDKKKKKYFTGRGGVSSFVITTTVLEKNEWTPTVVMARQQELVDTIKRGWKLQTGNVAEKQQGGEDVS